MKNHGSRFLLIFVVVALAIAAFARGGIRFGLDLQGGASLAYRVEFDVGEGRRVDKSAAMTTLVEVLDGRLNASGVGGISIIPQGDNDGIVIEIPGRGKGQIDRIRKVLESQGSLAFRMVAPEADVLHERGIRKNMELVGVKEEPKDKRFVWYPDQETEDRGQALGADAPPPWKTDILVLEPERPLKLELEEARAAHHKPLIDKWKADEGIPLTEEFELTPLQVAELSLVQAEADRGFEQDEGIREKIRELADISRREVFRGSDLAETRVQQQLVEIVVFFKMKPDRRADFKSFTTRGVKKQMAVILDGKVSSAPVIQSPLPGEGIISGGGSGFDRVEANELKIVLASGSTGAKLTLEREEVLGPGLGADAIERGKLSIGIGFILVLLAMIWMYRAAGLVANVALLLNVVLLVGTLAAFYASLTLAGIAGVVLTLGMAVDANILIFERMREERGRGKSLLESVAAGFDRALVAIVDANVTTVLTAVVLIVVGSGTVRGFGVTLTIGILASMFTAIYVTRTIFEWAIDKGWMKTLSIREREPFAFDFMSQRRFFTGVSLIVMIAGLALFLSRPENDSKDLEFIGGEQVIVQLNEAMSRPAVLDLVKSPSFPDVQAVRLEPRLVEIKDAAESNRWQIRTPTAKSAGNEDSGGNEELFANHVRNKFGTRLVPPGITNFEAPGETDTGPVQLDLNTFGLPDGVTTDSLKTLIEGDDTLSQVTITPVEGSATQFQLTATSSKATEVAVTDAIEGALRNSEPQVFLSDPIPSVSFLNPSRAEELWRAALRAVLLAMLLQVMYIRLRFADFKHGFAAVCALVHDVTIALGCVALVDSLGLVHAKINLVLVAGFLTLIGYSMNDTIVVFDRIRENLGKSKVVRTKGVNTAINQTLSRSIRTSITTFLVVAVQFVLNLNTGSVLEGFAFVMMVGVVSGTYSSIFIAGPLLLFLPEFWRRFSGNRKRMWAQLVLTAVGAILVVTDKTRGPQMMAGIVMAANLPIYFLLHFVPWLGHSSPDDFLQEEIDLEARSRPIVKPGI